jgi:hypothetical protein
MFLYFGLPDFPDPDLTNFKIQLNQPFIPLTRLLKNNRYLIIKFTIPWMIYACRELLIVKKC